MSKNKEKHVNCPVEKALSVIGKKYAVLIVRDLLTGKKRFGELLSSLEGISPRTLSMRLDELEEDKVIKKKIFPVIPLHVEYSLTHRGVELHSILEQMSEWGAKIKR
jgi:DNA-binding HxlR family transcriptional regulator